MSDYHLVVESLDPEVVAFAPMVAAHHPRVIAVGEGRGDLLRVTLQLADICRLPPTGGRRSKGSSTRSNVPSPALATATANVEVDFASGDLPHRPEFVQNDGGGTVQGGSSHHHRERKIGREIAPDLHDIIIGKIGIFFCFSHDSHHLCIRFFFNLKYDCRFRWNGWRGRASTRGLGIDTTGNWNVHSSRSVLLRHRRLCGVMRRLREQVQAATDGFTVAESSDTGRCESESGSQSIGIGS